MKKWLIGVLAIGLMGIAGCTANQRAKSFGGTQRINIKSGQKLVNLTWKGDDLWILTTQMENDYKPQIFRFQEDSSYGIAEGTIILKESR